MAHKSEAAKKQSGEIAPDVDEDGKMINPHNPDFITKVPWYLGNSGPTLKHHSLQKSDKFLSLSETDELIREKVQAQKEVAKSTARTVFRKGACKNCGAMTHKEKDCIERPRSSKRSAWKTGLDIAPDEVALRLEDHGKVSYSAKRDNYKGYDGSEYALVVARFQRMEEEKKRIKQEQREQKRKEEEEEEEKLQQQQRRKKEETESAKKKSKGKVLALAIDIFLSFYKI